jgi:hypothetical protein
MSRTMGRSEMAGKTIRRQSTEPSEMAIDAAVIAFLQQ